MRMEGLALAALFSAVTYLGAIPVFTQASQETGKLKIHVEPKQAYVFVDGKAIRDGSQTIEVAAGEHRVGVYNYGYLPQTKEIHVGAGETTDLALQPAVGGRRGRRTLRGHRI